MIGLLFCGLGCTREPVDTHASVDLEGAFAQNLLPILTAKCALTGCHIAEGPHGLDFRTYASFIAGGEHGPAFIPGNAGESAVVEEIVSGRMPPGGAPLTGAEIQAFKDWINQQEPPDHVVPHEHEDDRDEAPDAAADDHDDNAHVDDDN